MALPPLPAVAFAPTVRSVLDAVGYTDREIIDRLGGPDLSARERPRLLRATRAGTPLDTLIRLFLLAATSPEDAARGALLPSRLEDWIDAGLLEREPDGVRARYVLFADLEMRLVSDLRRHSLEPNYVVGLGRSSSLGIRATPRAAVRSVLDLGTGSGGASLLLARHAERVVATDINPRALALAAFNVALNGAAKVELRQGDLFAPVAGQRFDLVVANPPFVIGPRSGLLYRDGGLDGDSFVERIVREAPEYLELGGHCVLTAHWAETTKSAWDDRLAGWARDTACDVLFARMESISPARYAAGWLIESARVDREDYDESWERWVSHLEQREIEAIGSGLIVLRKTNRPARAWFLESFEDIDQGGGDALVRLLDARALVASASEEELLALRPHVAPGLRLDQGASAGEAGWTIESCFVRRRQGLHLSVRANVPVVSLVSRANGERSVAELAAQTANELGVDPAEVTAETARIVRGLLEHGILDIR
jgi:methylase of polypeptide subunit release factors